MKTLIVLSILLLGACGPGVPNGGGDGAAGGDGGAAGDRGGTAGPGVWLGTVRFGSNDNDGAYGAIVDSKAALTVFGATHGRLAPEGNVTMSQWFVTRLAPSGRRLWTRQLIKGAATRGALGPHDEIYVAGEGGLARFDDNGTLLWALAEPHFVIDVAVGPDGDVYIAGVTGGPLMLGTVLPPIGPGAGTYDGYVVRVSPNGQVKSSITIGSNQKDWINGLAIGSQGEMYLGGPTLGTLPGATPVDGLENGFLLRVEADGTVKWAKQFNDLIPNALRLDAAGNVHLSGGGIARHDATTGDRVWLTQLPKLSAGDLAIDKLGRPWVVGRTLSTSVAFVAVLDTAGKPAAIRYLPASPTIGPTTDPNHGDLWEHGESLGSGLAADPAGFVYVVGETTGDLAGNVNASSLAPGLPAGSDAFVARLDMDARVEGVSLVASPSTIALAAGAAAKVTATPLDARGLAVAATSSVSWTSSASLLATVDAGGSVQGVAAGRAYATPSFDRITGVPAAVKVGDPFGTLLFGTPHGDVPHAVTLDQDSILIGGWSDDAWEGQTLLGGRDALLVRLDATGNRTWVAQTGGGGQDSIKALAGDVAGNTCAITTTTTPLPTPDPNPSVVVVSTDRAGARRWQFDPDWPVQRGRLGGIAVDVAGNVFVSGAIDDRTIVIKLDSGGHELWRYTTVPAAFGFIKLAAEVIALAPSGDIIVAGVKDSGQFEHSFLLAIDPAGTRVK